MCFFPFIFNVVGEVCQTDTLPQVFPPNIYALPFNSCYMIQSTRSSLFHQPKYILNIEFINLLIVQTPPTFVSSTLSRTDLIFFSEITLHFPVYLTHLNLFRSIFSSQKKKLIYNRPEDECMQSKPFAFIY
jgi:hypothetical protein